MAVKCATFSDEGMVWPELEEDDIRVENHGSKTRLIGLTDAGKTFLLDEGHSEGCQWMGDALEVKMPDCNVQLYRALGLALSLRCQKQNVHY